MKDEQKVYIKGNYDRGNEVIKLLINLGGNNYFSYKGKDKDAIYFINPQGIINNTSDSNTSMILPYIKEFYKEISLPRWRPKSNEHYYFINNIGNIIPVMWNNTHSDDLRYKFGNCFITYEEAKATRDKIKEILNDTK